jgi:hypothetical protein
MWTEGVPVDESARLQLANTARMPFIYQHIAVMPDVRLGKGSTIGSVVATLGAVIPAAVGVDIGCGMMAARTTLTANVLPDNLGPLRSAIERAIPHGMSPKTRGYRGRDEGSWNTPPAPVDLAWAQLKDEFDAICLKAPKLKNTNNYRHLATLGSGGNHFVEVCLDEVGFVWLMLHSGSRGVGSIVIELDGSAGEGGGQVLRTSLTLSMITGQPFNIKNIRARRAEPGLMRQHLGAVQAAARVSEARVMDADLGSQALTFAQARIKSGDYEFAIGTAGICTLVLQTILPALLYGDAASTVRITGGTHNPMAPPVQFLQRVYCRLLRAMGAEIEIEILRAGFYPAGGGVVRASVAPCVGLRPLDLVARGKRLSGYAESIVAGVSASVARRELECIGTGMGCRAIA